MLQSNVRSSPWLRMAEERQQSKRFLGCKYACGQFLRQEPHASGHGGWIINTASIMGLVGQKVNGGKADSWIRTLMSV